MDVAGSGVPPVPGRRILRIGEGGRPEPFRAEPVAASGDVWARISVEEYLRPPGEEPTATPLRHLVVLNVGEGYRREHHWEDPPAVIHHTLETGRLAIFPAGHRYGCRWFDPAHVLLLTVEPSLLMEVAELAPGEAPRLRRVLNEPDEVLAHLMLSLREAIRDDARRSGPYGEMLARAVAYRLTGYLTGRDKGAERAVRSGLPASRLRRISEHVDRQLEAPLSLRELARVANLSVFHFARSFKESTGLSPHQYVLRRRVERAKQLLGGTALNLAEIALRCGFSNPSHFTQAFHQICGVTPTSWRTSARSGED